MAFPIPSQNNAAGFLGFRSIEKDHKTGKSKGCLSWFYNYGPTNPSAPLSIPGYQINAGISGPNPWFQTSIVPQAFLNNVDFGTGKAIEFDVMMEVLDSVGIFPRMVLYIPTTQQVISVTTTAVEETGTGAQLCKSQHFIIPSNVSIHDNILLAVEDVGVLTRLSWTTRLTIYNYDVAPVWS